MFSTSARLLLLGTCLFCVGAIMVYLGLEGGHHRFLGTGIGVICLSSISLAVGGRLRRGEKNPLERRREQRLWRSGPLGRIWLKNRNRLP